MNLKKNYHFIFDLNLCCSKINGNHELWRTYNVFINNYNFT